MYEWYHTLPIIPFPAFLFFRLYHSLKVEKHVSLHPGGLVHSECSMNQEGREKKGRKSREGGNVEEGVGEREGGKVGKEAGGDGRGCGREEGSLS